MSNYLNNFISRMAQMVENSIQYVPIEFEVVLCNSVVFLLFLTLGSGLLAQEQACI